MQKDGGWLRASFGAKQRAGHTSDRPKLYLYLRIPKRAGQSDGFTLRSSEASASATWRKSGAAPSGDRAKGRRSGAPGSRARLREPHRAWRAAPGRGLSLLRKACDATHNLPTSPVRRSSSLPHEQPGPPWFRRLGTPDQGAETGARSPPTTTSYPPPVTSEGVESAIL